MRRKLSDKSLYVAGVEKDSLSIYKRQSSNKFNLIKKFSWGDRTFPKELEIYNNQIILLAGVRKGLYIENHIMKSRDGGKPEWRKRYTILRMFHQ